MDVVRGCLSRCGCDRQIIRRPSGCSKRIKPSARVHSSFFNAGLQAETLLCSTFDLSHMRAQIESAKGKEKESAGDVEFVFHELNLRVRGWSKGQSWGLSIKGGTSPFSPKCFAKYVVFSFPHHPSIVFSARTRTIMDPTLPTSSTDRPTSVPPRRKPVPSNNTPNI